MVDINLKPAEKPLGPKGNKFRYSILELDRCTKGSNKKITVELPSEIKCTTFRNNLKSIMNGCHDKRAALYEKIGRQCQCQCGCFYALKNVPVCCERSLSQAYNNAVVYNLAEVNKCLQEVLDTKQKASSGSRRLLQQPQQPKVAQLKINSSNGQERRSTGYEATCGCSFSFSFLFRRSSRHSRA